MLDEIAIQQTLNRYSEGASRADWNQVMPTFLPDATWEIPALKARYQDHSVIQKVMRRVAMATDCCALGSSGRWKYQRAIAAITPKSAPPNRTRMAASDSPFCSFGKIVAVLMQTKPCSHCSGGL